nr:MAG TPA: hypothetical protein [Caudoviricetes sp.]
MLYQFFKEVHLIMRLVNITSFDTTILPYFYM